ncbi:MAG: hypothetical protein OEZ06_27310 [Myxococcales bacterium]|nr:hypothetical protein [Myxococcales bacterium]
MAVADSDGGMESTLARGTTQPMSLAADGSGVHWTTASSAYTLLAQPGTEGTVMGVQPAHGDSFPLALAHADPASVASNGEQVCWVNNGAASVVYLAPRSEGVCP